MILLLLFPNLSFMKLGSLQKYKSNYKGLVALERGIALQVLNRAKGGSEDDGGYPTVSGIEQFQKRIRRFIAERAEFDDDA
jgi:hypothetical protein